MTNDRDNVASRSNLLIVVAATLMLFGLVAVATTSASLDQPFLGPALFRTALGRQMVFVLTGLLLMIGLSRLPLSRLESSKWMRACPWLLLAVTLIGLIAAMVPGIASSSGGSHRWLRFTVAGFPVGFQPSELAKLALVVVLASILVGPFADARSFRRGFLPAALVIGLFMLLVGVEDFGTATLLGMTGVGMLLVAGCRLRYLGVLALVGVAGMAGLLFAAPYRLERIKSFLDFGGDPSGAGYQPLQSLVTIASGGWFGTGLGLGVQKYGYLPASRTDFIFSVICEETGILGGLFVIALFGLLVWLGLRTMQSAATPLGRLIAFGLTAVLGLQAVMNLAVVTVMAPTTGISLPFISVGGSGVLVYAVAIGLLAATARGAEANKVDREPSFSVSMVGEMPSW